MNDSVNDDINVCLTGNKLHGNDFGQAQIDEWFTDEADGYFNLTHAESSGYTYVYHAVNVRHGYGLLPACRFGHVLGVGSAYGDELQPILGRSDRISILEPSDGFKSTELHGVPINYVKPISSGDMPFDAGSFDLITCLGVLHHIPNVSKVLSEFYRVLKPGGYALVREPIISMGDWRKPRVGLTKRERGIPLSIFRDIVLQSGFAIVSERKCMFSLTSRLKYFISGAVYNSPVVVGLDQFICSLPIWTKVYHARNTAQKLRPTAVYFVLKKPLSVE